MDEIQEIQEEYGLDSVPSREPVYEFEDEDKYEIIGWLKASEKRKRILEMLLMEPMTTNEIADELGLERDSAYYHIQVLQQGEMIHSDDSDSYPSLIESKTPHKQSFNLWGLTEDGLYAAKWLFERD